MGKLLALALFAFVLLSGVTVIMTIDPFPSRACDYDHGFNR
jgi:hypothetical protein